MLEEMEIKPRYNSEIEYTNWELLYSSKNRINWHDEWRVKCDWHFVLFKTGEIDTTYEASVLKKYIPRRKLAILPVYLKTDGSNICLTAT